MPGCTAGSVTVTKLLVVNKVKRLCLKSDLNATSQTQDFMGVRHEPLTYKESPSQSLEFVRLTDPGALVTPQEPVVIYRTSCGSRK